MKRSWEHTASTSYAVPDFSCARLLVVGDVMLDRYWHGHTSRISPEAPVPVVNVGEEESRMGGAGNVAVNAAILGARTQLLCLVGDDATADTIETMLADKGVACILQRVPGSKTITKLRVMSRHQQLIRLDFEDHFPNWDAEALQSDFSKRLADVDAVILSDYGKGVLRRVPGLIAAARKAGVPVIVDPKGTDFERYRGATLITPNLSEFEALVGRCENDDDIVRRGIAGARTRAAAPPHPCAGSVRCDRCGRYGGGDIGGGDCCRHANE
jgi:rfaE bifunctional protein kinase chain/domain